MTSTTPTWRLDDLPLRWRFTSREEALLAALVPRLPTLHPAAEVRADRAYRAERVTRGGEGVAVWRGRRPPAVVAGFEQAADLIVEDLQRFLAHRAPGLVLIHAGVVGWRGRALVVPGRSCSGKSRLVAALLEAGASYLSDELAVVDGDGRVLPYARPLALRRDGGGVERVAAAALGAEVSSALPIGGIAFLRYAAGAPWAPRSLSPGESFLELLRHTVAARQRWDLTRETLRPLVRRVPVIAGERGEAAAAAARLLEWSEAGDSSRE